MPREIDDTSRSNRAQLKSKVRNTVKKIIQWFGAGKLTIEELEKKAVKIPTSVLLACGETDSEKERSFRLLVLDTMNQCLDELKRKLTVKCPWHPDAEAVPAIKTYHLTTTLPCQLEVAVEAKFSEMWLCPIDLDEDQMADRMLARENGRWDTRAAEDEVVFSLSDNIFQGLLHEVVGDLNMISTTRVMRSVPAMKLPGLGGGRSLPKIGPR